MSDSPTVTGRLWPDSSRLRSYSIGVPGKFTPIDAPPLKRLAELLKPDGVLLQRLERELTKDQRKKLEQFLASVLVRYGYGAGARHS
jgi:hypothetical protein